MYVAELQFPGSAQQPGAFLPLPVVAAGNCAQQSVSIGESWVQPNGCERGLPSPRNPLMRRQHSPETDFQISLGEGGIRRGIIGIKRDGTRKFLQSCLQSSLRHLIPEMTALQKQRVGFQRRLRPARWQAIRMGRQGDM